MRKRIIVGCIAAILLGTGMHFLYELLPNRFVALFAPVNESVWEHLKLLFWPPLLVMAVLSRSAQNKNAFWEAALTSLLAMPVLLLTVYYTALGAFGVESLIFDIVLYVLVMVAGFWLLEKLWSSERAAKQAGVLAMVTGIYAIMLILFSLGAPDLPIFVSKV